MTLLKILPFLFVFPLAIQALDPSDGPAVQIDPSTDITNLYAWMQDSSQINLIMTVHPNATTASSFSTRAQYVFHVRSSATFGASQGETQILCQFADSGNVSCQLSSGMSLVSNVDASSETGVVSSNGLFRIFTGLRNDPSFFDSTNYDVVRTTVRDLASQLTYDEARCPQLDSTTRTGIINTLTGNSGGLTGSRSPSVNNYASANTLAIVIQMSINLLGNGPIYGVSASTQRL